MIKLTPKVLRKDLNKLSISNVAIARELEVSVSDAKTFRTGNNVIFSDYKLAKLAAFIRDTKRNQEMPT